MVQSEKVTTLNQDWTGAEVEGTFAIFALFLTRHLVRHSTECEGGSSKSDGWFAAKKGGEGGGDLTREK